MPAPLQVVLYCLFILLASLAGGWISLVGRLTHTRTQMLMSFVAGLMLGVGLFHMLPHAAIETGSLDQAVWWMMVGLLIMFFLQRFFHFHQHGPTEMGLDGAGPYADAPIVHRHHHDHDHDHHHDHDHDGGHAHAGQHAAHRHPPHDGRHGHALSWLGIAVGLTIHTLLDGIALAASVEVESAAPGLAGLAGVGTFLAIVLHKPLDAMAITMLMTSRGWTGGATTLINILFGLMCPLGALVFYFGAASLGSLQPVIVGAALGFAAGAFLCISLADLLPEIQFHSHDPAKLSAALVAGALLAFAIRLIEPDHAHDLPGHAHERLESEATHHRTVDD